MKTKLFATSILMVMSLAVQAHPGEELTLAAHGLSHFALAGLLFSMVLVLSLAARRWLKQQ